MYRIINTTVKKPRLDKQGKDVRTAVERVGHAVSFKGDRGQDIILSATRSVILKDLDEGLLGLQRGNYVRIEQIKDVAEALKQHAEEGTEARSERTKAAAAKRADGRRAKAVEMGETPDLPDADDEYEGAINPDGKPNFVATAKKKTKKKSASKKATKKKASGRKKAIVNDDDVPSPGDSAL